MANPSNTGIGTGTAQVYTGDKTYAALQSALGKVDAKGKTDRAAERQKKARALKRQEKIQDQLRDDYKGIYKDQPWERDVDEFRELVSNWKEASNKSGKDGFLSPEERRDVDEAYADIQKQVLVSKGNKEVASNYQKMMLDPTFADEYTDEQRLAYQQAIMTPGANMKELDMTFRKNILPVADYGNNILGNGDKFYKTIEKEFPTDDGGSYSKDVTVFDEEAFDNAFMQQYTASQGGAGYGKMATAVNDEYGEAAAQAGMAPGEYALQEYKKGVIAEKEKSTAQKAAKASDSGTEEKPNANWEYFKDSEEGAEGYSLSNTKGRSLAPMSVTIKNNDNQEKTASVIPTEVVRTAAGIAVRGVSVKNSWRALTDAEKKEWKAANPKKDPANETQFITKEDVVDIEVTPAVKAKLKAQYGFDVEENFKSNNKSNESKSEGVQEGDEIETADGTAIYKGGKWVLK
jgi:hypothetical protein